MPNRYVRQRTDPRYVGPHHSLLSGTRNGPVKERSMANTAASARRLTQLALAFSLSAALWQADVPAQA